MKTSARMKSCINRARQLQSRLLRSLVLLDLRCAATRSSPPVEARLATRQACTSVFVFASFAALAITVLLTSSASSSSSRVMLGISSASSRCSRTAHIWPANLSHVALRGFAWPCLASLRSADRLAEAGHALPLRRRLGPQLLGLEPPLPGLSKRKAAPLRFEASLLCAAMCCHAKLRSIAKLPCAQRARSALHPLPPLPPDAPGLVDVLSSFKPLSLQMPSSIKSEPPDLCFSCPCFQELCLRTA